MHRGTSANVKEKGGKISRQGDNMFSGQPGAKGYFVEAIISEGEIDYPKNIGFRPNTFIPNQICCNIIKHILFLKVIILRDRDVEVLTNHSSVKFINMAPNKDFLKLWFPLDNNVVIKVCIKLMHNLSNKPRDVTNGRLSTPILYQFLHTQSPKTIKLYGSLNNEATGDIFFKLSFSTSKR